ncbi:MAG: Gfo/Idh/MocA family protein [Acutalibacteraceae bacterium]
MGKELLNFGIVGIGGRPRAFLDAFSKTGRARLASVCDRNADTMAESMKDLPDVKRYTDYEEMLEKEDLDAVVIGTPMPLHVPQTLLALEKNINVFCEVTAAVSLAECRQLVDACKRSKAQYMMGENCNYMRPYMVVRNMVRGGFLGDVFYAEGEYNHDCRELISKTPWRKKWLYDIGGITYGTHSLGPILSWFANDRVSRVCCAGSGRNLCDLSGNPLQRDNSYVMLCKTEKNRLIKIKNNLSSPRPYGLNYVLEGSKGAFQSFGQTNELWLDGISERETWDALSKHEEKFVPEIWRVHADENNRNGHSGADVITMIDYINALYDGKKVPIDVHAALDMTLPGLISQQSVLEGGKWISVPDSRHW